MNYLSIYNSDKNCKIHYKLNLNIFKKKNYSERFFKSDSLKEVVKYYFNLK